MSFALNCWPLLNSTSDCCLVKLPTVWLQIRNAPLTLKTSFHLILLKLTKWSFLVCCEWLLRVYKKGLRTNLWTVWSEAAQSCPILCDPMDYSLPGSSIHGIFQARILEWDAISFSRRSSQPRDWTWVSYVVGRRFTVRATREALL